MDDPWGSPWLEEERDGGSEALGMGRAGNAQAERTTSEGLGLDGLDGNN